MTPDSQFPIHDADRTFEQQIQRLYEISLQRRWLFVATCWLTLGAYGIWGLRQQISLGFDYFTWALVRYSVVFDPIPSLCVGFCVATTVSSLVGQSRNILFGFSPQYRRHLEKQLWRIRALGTRHPLWKRICE
jgi:hypothetical protein